MTKSWQSGNSYLRLLSTLPADPKKRMIFCTQSERELQLVLEAVRQFKTFITVGEVQTEVTRSKDKPDGRVEVYIDDSKEIF